MTYIEKIQNGASITLHQINEEVLAAVDEREPHIVLLNLKQVNKGKKSDGKDILPKYTPATVAIKKKKGQPTDRVTLYDTGSFYAGWLIHSEEFPILFNSADPKTGDLVKKYGAAIFGLDRESQRTLNQTFLKADIQRRIRGLLYIR